MEIIEQMSSSGSSSSSDSGSCSGSGDDDSSSSDGEHESANVHLSPSREPLSNGTDKSQGNNQLMNTLSEYRMRTRLKDVNKSM